jgi:hypothetical protein
LMFRNALYVDLRTILHLSVPKPPTKGMQAHCMTAA